MSSFEEPTAAYEAEVRANLGVDTQRVVDGFRAANIRWAEALLAGQPEPEITAFDERAEELGHELVTHRG